MANVASPAEVLRALASEIALPEDLVAASRLTGDDPVLATPYRVGTAGAAAMAAGAIAAAEVWRLRGGRSQCVEVEAAHAAVALRSGRYFRINGAPGPEPFDAVTGYYPVRGGRWLYAQNNALPHRAAFFRLLGTEADKTAAAQRTREWDGEALEDAVHAAGGVAGLVRSDEEWRHHQQGRCVHAAPLLSICRIGAAEPAAFSPAARPLAGVRVLDLTRVIAGPVCSRTLAAHGADVLRVSAGHLPDIGVAELDTGLGKLATRLDLRHPDDRLAFQGLVGAADVFVQGYRPRALAGLGYAPEDVARLRPGIVCVDLSAWGPEGPWAGRRGYDSVVQAVSGMSMRSGSAERPATMPVSAIDHVTGHLMAAGAALALRRRAVEGGSWRVEISLAAVGAWIAGLGLVEHGSAAPADLPAEAIERLCQHTLAPDGRIRHLGPVVRMSATPPFWQRPPVPLAYHLPVWPAR